MYQESMRLIKKVIRNPNRGFNCLSPEERKELYDRGIIEKMPSHDERGNRIYEPEFTDAGMVAYLFALSEQKTQGKLKRLRESFKGLQKNYKELIQELEQRVADENELFREAHKWR